MDQHKVTFHTLHAESPELKPALRIYVDTFKTESITSYNFNFNDPQTEKLYYKAAQLMAKVAMANGDDIIIAKMDDDVVGLALISKPGQKSFRQTIGVLFPDIFSLMPLLTKIKYRNLLASGKAMQLSESLQGHFVTLQIVAVSSRYQGQGIGKIFLDEIRERYMSNFDGIYLYTANATNKEIYKHLGYELFENTQGGDLDVYHMVYHY